MQEQEYNIYISICMYVICTQLYIKKKYTHTFMKFHKPSGVRMLDCATETLSFQKKKKKKNMYIYTHVYIHITEKSRYSYIHIYIHIYIVYIRSLRPCGGKNTRVTVLHSSVTFALAHPLPASPLLFLPTTFISFDPFYTYTHVYDVCISPYTTNLYIYTGIIHIQSHDNPRFTCRALLRGHLCNAFC